MPCSAASISPRHLAQFRLDIGEFQLRVNLLFGLARHRSSAFQRGERIFVERPAHVQRAAAQRDVVRLRSREIEQRRAEGFLFEQPHIHLQAVAQQKADFIFAVRERLLDARIFQDMLGHRVDVFLLVLSGTHGDEQDRDRQRFLGRGAAIPPASPIRRRRLLS